MTWTLDTLNPLEKKKNGKKIIDVILRGIKKEKECYIIVPSEIPNSAALSKSVF